MAIPDWSDLSAADQVRLVDVLNGGILKAWNWLASKIPGVPKSLQDLQIPVPQWAAATGGVIPGYAPGVDSQLAMVSPGEAILRPEVTRALGADTIHAWNRAAIAGALPRFADGGIWGGIAGALSGAAGDIWGGIKGIAGDVWDAAKAVADPVKWLTSVVTGPIGAMSRFANTDYGQLVTAVPKGIASEFVDFVKSIVSIGGTGKAGFTGGVGNFGTGPLAVWRNLRSEGLTRAQAAGVMGNIQVESAGTFSPWIVQGGGYSKDPAAAGSGGYGLVQWTPGVKLIPYLNGQPASIATEVAALISQLNGVGPSGEGAAGAALRAASSPAEAAMAFLRDYERPADPNQPDRATYAQSFFDKFKSYDQGGLVGTGYQLFYNGTGAAEIVAPRQDFEQAISGMGGGTASFEGNLYLDSGEFIGRVRGEANSVVDDRVNRAKRRERSGAKGGALAHLTRGPG